MLRYFDDMVIIGIGIGIGLSERNFIIIFRRLWWNENAIFQKLVRAQLEIWQDGC